MFMPGYQEPKPNPEIQRAKAQLDFDIQKARYRKPTPEDLAAQEQIAMRMNRARKAAAEGKPADQINAIMRGVL